MFRFGSKCNTTSRGIKQTLFIPNLLYTVSGYDHGQTHRQSYRIQIVSPGGWLATGAGVDWLKKQATDPKAWCRCSKEGRGIGDRLGAVTLVVSGGWYQFCGISSIASGQV